MTRYCCVIKRFKTAIIVIGCMKGKPDLSNAENLNLTFSIFSRICVAEVEKES